MQAVAGIILAAGMSKRLGYAKQLLKLDGKHLLQWVVEAAIASSLEKIYLVLGYRYGDILKQMPLLTESDKTEVLHNPDYVKGMSSSVKKGISAVQGYYGAVMFLLGDQPFFSSQMIDLLISKYLQSSKVICAPVYGGLQRNPVIFNETFYQRLSQISGDRGGRQIIQENHNDVLFVPIGEDLQFLDIDSKEDLDNCRKRLAEYQTI